MRESILPGRAVLYQTVKVGLTKTKATPIGIPTDSVSFLQEQGYDMGPYEPRCTSNLSMRMSNDSGPNNKNCVPGQETLT